MDSDAARARLAALRTIPLVDVTVEAIEMNRELVDRGALPPSTANDAAHIANATLLPRIEEVCQSSGYEPPVICTHRALVETAHSGSTGMVMQGTRTDPIIDELHSIRDQHAARFGYDVDVIFRTFKLGRSRLGASIFGCQLVESFRHDRSTPLVDTGTQPLSGCPK